MTRIKQVKDYHAIVDVYNLGATMYFTNGNGSMIDSIRVKGWVVFESPKLGDQHDFAKWFPNRKLAQLELRARQ